MEERLHKEKSTLKIIWHPQEDKRVRVCVCVCVCVCGCV